MNELLVTLCADPSPIRIPYDDAPPRIALHNYLEERIVPVLFTETLGGTELDIMLDPIETRLDEADGNWSAGVLRLEGDLILNDIPVRARIEVDWDTLTGWGQLYPRPDAALPVFSSSAAFEG